MTRSASIEHCDADAGDLRPAIGERRLSALRPIPRRGLSRTEAAMYIGYASEDSQIAQMNPNLNFGIDALLAL